MDILIPAARKLADAGCTALIWPAHMYQFCRRTKWAIDQAEALTKATGLVVTSALLALLQHLGRALEGAVGQLQFIRVGLRRRGVSTRLRLRWDRSPMTCAAVAKFLPVEGQVFHAKYANNEIYFLTPMVDEVPPSEWRCLYPGPGDLLFLPIDSGHSANLVNNALAGNLPPMDLKKGILDFAFFYERGNSLIGPAGPSGGSLFATGTSFDELEQVADAARHVWFHGAVGEVMYIIPD